MVYKRLGLARRHACFSMHRGTEVARRAIYVVYVLDETMLSGGLSDAWIVGCLVSCWVAWQMLEGYCRRCRCVLSV